MEFGQCMFCGSKQDRVWLEVIVQLVVNELMYSATVHARLLNAEPQLPIPMWNKYPHVQSYRIRFSFVFTEDDIFKPNHNKSE